MEKKEFCRSVDVRKRREEEGDENKRVVIFSVFSSFVNL
jgi:hypothetical protein